MLTPKYRLQMFSKMNQCWQTIKVKLNTKTDAISALDRVSAVERTTPFRIVEKQGRQEEVIAQRLIAKMLN